MTISIFIRLQLFVLCFAMLSCNKQINTAEDLITAHIKALGGYDSLKAIKTISVIGIYEEPTFKQVHRFDKKRPNLIRITTNYDEQTGAFGYCEGFDGAAWEYSFKIPVRVIGEPARALKNASPYEPSYIDYKRKGHQAKFLGKTIIKGHQVYHLQITCNNGKIDNFFFDVNTLLESVSIGNVPFHGEGAIIEIFEKRSDYRPVAGVLMPFKIEQMSGDKILSTFTSSKIEANKDLPDKWFSPPLSREQEMFTAFRMDMLAGKFEQMVSQYDEYKKLANKQFNQKLENQLNTFGYELNSHKRYEDAIEIFKLAISYNPRSGNLHDSLGETYLLSGDTTNAVLNYKKSIELDPDNKHGMEVLSKITAAK